MAKKRLRETYIEGVAGVLVESYPVAWLGVHPGDPGPGSMWEYAKQINDAPQGSPDDGWGFDMGADHGNWIRVRGLKLTDADLAEAVALAEEWIGWTE